ncbi:MAG: UvrD-helicase domain-containing protein [Bacteroidota bacterium]|nr:UvrD-helicase domain-containing protein [Bacteroidota bacterium]
MQNSLNIYRASAGSGKTFFLTASFLKLAFADPDNYKKILAVTFTNKAAEEMKTRITEEIDLMVRNPQKSAHFANIKEEYPNYSNKQIQALAESIRDRILHNYSLFSVSTIDSFVQKIIRAFTYEMSLQSNYNIQLDSDSVIAELRDRLYEKVKDNKKLLSWLIQFAEYKIDENKSWDFNNDIEALSKEILKEQFQSMELFFEEEDSTKKLEELRVILRKTKKDFESTMNALAKTAENEIKKTGIDHTKLGQRTKYAAEYFLSKIKAKDFVPVATVLKIMDNPDEWPNKSANDEVRDKINTLYNILNPLLNKAVETYNAQYPVYISANEVLKNFYALGVLGDIASLLPDYRKENNELLISDTTLLLKELIKNNDAPFIYEKAGNKYDHILIDEFQDTSNFQWENFKPLIRNSLASAKFNLIVGDIKQSIYSWRGGDWSLLLHKVKEQIGQEFITENNLPFNWRSAGHIVRFNNTLFRRMPHILQTVFNQNVEENSTEDYVKIMKENNRFSMITDAYASSMQKTTQDDKAPGFVRLDFIIKEKGDTKEDYDIEIAQRLPEHINSLLEKNYSAGDIGILVRTNEQSKKVMDMIYNYQETHEASKKYAVVSASSAALSKSDAVKILIGAFKYLNDPKNQITAVELALEYQAHKNSKTLKKHQIIASAKHIEEFLPEKFARRQEAIREMHLFELTEELLDMFELRKAKNDFEFIRSFQDLVLNYVQKKGNLLDEFVDWWDEKGHQESLLLSEKQNAVKIQTIHKSKGLAYEHVIVPFADWSISPKANDTFWAKADSSIFGDLQYFPVKYSKKLGDTIFRTSYYEHSLQAHTESLNLLYVVLTRAKQSLLVFCPQKQNPDKITTVADLLYHAVHQTQSSEEDQQNYQDTTPYFDSISNRFIIGALSESKKSEPWLAKSAFETEYPGNRGVVRPDISYQSKDFFIESLDYIEDKVNYGSLMHKIFEGITTIEDINPVIKNLHAEGYITKEESNMLAKEVKSIIQRPKVAPWFKPGIEVITEKAIITEEGQTRIPDRVVIENDKITVIDFKFGKQRKEHLSQIKEYQSLLEKIYGAKVDTALYYAELDEIINETKQTSLF